MPVVESEFEEAVAAIQAAEESAAAVEADVVEPSAEENTPEEFAGKAECLHPAMGNHRASIVCSVCMAHADTASGDAGEKDLVSSRGTSGEDSLRRPHQVLRGSQFDLGTAIGAGRGTQKEGVRHRGH